MPTYLFDAFCPRSLVIDVEGAGEVPISIASPFLGSFERRFTARGLARGMVCVPLVPPGELRHHGVLFQYFKGTTLLVPPSVRSVHLTGTLETAPEPSPHFKVFAG